MNRTHHAISAVVCAIVLAAAPSLARAKQPEPKKAPAAQPTAAAPAAPAEPPPDPAKVRARAGQKRAGGIGMTAAGLFLLASGITLLVLGAQLPDVQGDFKARQALDISGGVILGGGAVSIALGALLWTDGNADIAKLDKPKSAASLPSLTLRF
jgi:chromate transport protein ChrA